MRTTYSLYYATYAHRGNVIGHGDNCAKKRCTFSYLHSNFRRLVFSPREALWALLLLPPALKLTTHPCLVCMVDYAVYLSGHLEAKYYAG
jgi:hypothetical protein